MPGQYLSLGELQGLFGDRLCSYPLTFARNQSASSSFSLPSQVEQHVKSAFPCEQLEAQIDELGRFIREEKARLAGHKPSEVNEILKCHIEKLKELKALLPKDSKFSQQSFEHQKAQEEKQKLEEKNRDKERSKKRREDKMEELSSIDGGVPLCQRKMFHFFAYTGNGPSFRYWRPDEEGFGMNGKDLELRTAQASQSDCSLCLDQSQALYLTQKWDGTTCQATNNAVFKRLDVRGGGGSKHAKDGKTSKGRKDSKPSGSVIASDRYKLYLVCWYDSATGQWEGLRDLDNISTSSQLADCLEPYLEKFRLNIPNGLCCYFEAVHCEINARYRSLSGIMPPHIRVFDFSVESASAVNEEMSQQVEQGNAGEPFFLRSITAIEKLAKQFGLPFVHYVASEPLQPGWTAQQVFQLLEDFRGKSETEFRRHHDSDFLCTGSSVNGGVGLVDAALEGFVARQDGGFVGKARVECCAVDAR